MCDIPKMIYGNKPADGGNLTIENEDLDEFIKKDPNAKKYIHPLLGASEYIKGNKRWCLWLVGADPEDLKKCPMIMERIKKFLLDHAEFMIAGAIVIGKLIK